VQFGHLLGGAVIVETVFGWPGLGKELITAISYRDYAVVQTCIFVMTFLVVAVNFAVDFGYRLIDPRLRRS
jgi:peptide/nickel transport system permease protein